MEQSTQENVTSVLDFTGTRTIDDREQSLIRDYCRNVWSRTFNFHKKPSAIFFLLLNVNDNTVLVAHKSVALVAAILNILDSPTTESGNKGLHIANCVFAVLAVLI